jgi:predicted DNA-binding transcriptional regulator AlpA
MGTPHDTGTAARVLTPQDVAQRRTFTIPESAQLLGVSEWAAYAAVRHGEFPLPTIKVGRRILVPGAPLRAVLGIADPEVSSETSGL